MKNIRLFTCLIALIVSLQAKAQEDYTITIKNDLKIITVENLGLAPSTPVMQVLIAMPELLVRPGETLFGNYDIQIEGMSLGVSTEEALINTRLFDVEKIEIEESAVSSYLNNGQGGSINIILKNPAKKGISGNANAAVYSLPDAQASAQVNYNKDKMLLRGWLSMEYYDPRASVVSTHYTSTIDDYFKYDTTSTNYGHEMARVMLKYLPSNNDKIEVNLSESLKLQTKDKSSSMEYLNGFDAKATANWEHKFNPRSALKIKADLTGNSSSNDADIIYNRNQSTETNTNQIAGKAEYWREMLKPGHNNLKLSAGANINWANQYEHILLKMKSGTIGLPEQDYSTTGNSFFVSPYILTESQFGRWHIKTSLEYQYYKYAVSSTLGDNFDKPRQDITGKVMVGWQFTDHQNVRLILDRKLKRPTYAQLYPYTLFNTTAMQNYKGNADLAPVLVHEIGADYITDFAWGKGYFVINANLHFINADGTIGVMSATSPYPQAIYGSIVTLPNPFEYKTYVNSGSNNILNAELMLLYQLGCFNLSVTGNLYESLKEEGESVDYYSFFNWSIHPAFHLKRDWTVSLKAIFNSKVYTASKTLGNYAYSYLNVDKAWKNMTFSLNALIPFTRYATDISQSDKLTISSQYSPMATYASLGFNYRF